MRLISRRTLILFFIPGAVFMLLFLLLPIGKMVLDSFFTFTRMGSREEFVWFDNYVTLFTTSKYIKPFVNTVIYVVISVSVEMVLGTFLAIWFSNSYRSMRFMRSLILSPLMMAPIVTGIIWRFMLSAQFGIVNQTLVNLGILNKTSDILWLADPKFALLSCCFADIWLTTPFIMLMMLAGISSLDSNMLEAARIDGANKLQQVFRVILPNLKTIILTALSIRVVDAARSFDIIWAMTQGGPNYASELISITIYKTLIKNHQEGLASAMAVVFVSILIAFALIFMRNLWSGQAVRKERVRK